MKLPSAVSLSCALHLQYEPSCAEGIFQRHLRCDFSPACCFLDHSLVLCTQHSLGSDTWTHCPCACTHLQWWKWQSWWVGGGTEREFTHSYQGLGPGIAFKRGCHLRDIVGGTSVCQMGKGWDKEKWLVCICLCVLAVGWGRVEGILGRCPETGNCRVCFKTL